MRYVKKFVRDQSERHLACCRHLNVGAIEPNHVILKAPLKNLRNAFVVALTKVVRMERTCFSTPQDLDSTAIEIGKVADVRLDAKSEMVPTDALFYLLWSATHSQILL